jgi:hypothetical protein
MFAGIYGQCIRTGVGLAQSILECMRRNIRPCWDAANLASKTLALKLGYEYSGEYLTIQMQKTACQDLKSGRRSDYLFTIP